MPLTFQVAIFIAGRFRLSSKQRTSACSSSR
jgi:hypothetical protein